MRGGEEEEEERTSVGMSPDAAAKVAAPRCDRERDGV